MSDEREVKISFQSKEEYVCPVCTTTFHREELLSGSGRLIAGALTDELHRLYEPSAKYGEVYPLLYLVTVCPECWFAEMDRGFSDLPFQVRQAAVDDRQKRQEETRLVFPSANFHNHRNLVSGAASYYLVMRSCTYFSHEFSPTIKQGLASLRTGWLLDELNRKSPGEHYDWLAQLFKKKAQYLYNEAIRRETNGEENLSALKVFGPDTDKNYSYEGALYLSGLLRYKYGFLANPQTRAKLLEESKRTIAKIFGVGKSSKSKPGALLENARALYENISKELNENDA